MDNEKVIHAYKGFDKDMKCLGFQYEVGKDYKQEGTIKCCNNGFHACEFPLDVFGYYAPGENSRYCTVTQSGETDKEKYNSKVASSKIHIETEIGLDGIIKAGVKFILDKVNWKNQKEPNTGDQSAATNTGYRSAATNTGDQSAATNTGYQSAAKVSGKESIAVVTGKDSKAAGALGDWIVLTERGEWDKDERIFPIKEVKAFFVDGEKIKADTFYKLVDGEAVEVK